uniref:CRAL-TRIO domain-containing protein n=1 Tax=Timema cristinae TaxID=61476 RepID=A0A7R9CBB8_TIMCR|nr:unnamed protein product [Timema cristinae]
MEADYQPKLSPSRGLTASHNDNEDPYPSLSDYHDYEPNLEFDDTELQHTAVNDDSEEKIEVSGLDYLESPVSDGTIEENFEEELVNAPIVPTGEDSLTYTFPDDEESEEDYKDVAKYGIVEVVGDDTYGRKVIVVSACKLPGNKELDHGLLLSSHRYSRNIVIGLELLHVTTFLFCASLVQDRIEIEGTTEVVWSREENGGGKEDQEGVGYGGGDRWVKGVRRSVEERGGDWAKVKGGKEAVEKLILLTTGRLRYLMYTLDKYVEQDYSLVYFHYGLTSKNKPSLSWLWQAYRAFDRKYKKNLKALYLVHPTNFIRVVWQLFKAAISAKFGRKVMYVNYLHELKQHLDLDQLSIPEPVLEHDERLMKKNNRTAPQPMSDSQQNSTFHMPLETQQFGVSLQFIKEHNNEHNNGEVIPPVVRHCIEFLSQPDGENIIYTPPQEELFLFLYRWDDSILSKQKVYFAAPQA